MEITLTEGFESTPVGWGTQANRGVVPNKFPAWKAGRRTINVASNLDIDVRSLCLQRADWFGAYPGGLGMAG
jgi:hypothetical protein